MIVTHEIYLSIESIYFSRTSGNYINKNQLIRVGSGRHASEQCFVYNALGFLLT